MLKKCPGSDTIPPEGFGLRNYCPYCGRMVGRRGGVPTMRIADHTNVGREPLDPTLWKPFRWTVQ